MSDCCQTRIETARLASRQRRLLIHVLVINAATFSMMVIASILSGSSALLSGALDNLGDALTYALSFAVVGASTTAKARVALFKGFMIVGAAVAVAAQIGWRLLNPETLVVETMSIAAILNLAANLVCLKLLWAFRDGDVNMASAFECSRNDVFEGVAVIVTAGVVWLSGSGWPDIVVAAALLMLFLRSAVRVLGTSWRELRTVEARS